jgi:hypothetical protein
MGIKGSRARRLADHDAHGRADGGDLDEDQQVALESLLTSPARVRRFGKVTWHVRRETLRDQRSVR